MLKRTHTMVDKYRASDLDKEIIPELSLRDIVFISAFFAVTRLPIGLVATKLRIPYIIFDLTAAVWLTRSPKKASYPKRLYHTIWYKLTKSQGELVYGALEPPKEDAI